MSTKHKSTLFAQTNKKKYSPQLFAGLQILHQHPQPNLSDKATHGTVARLQDQNLQFGTSSCVSTRHSHIHINGLSVLHVLATAHRQECLRGKQRWLAGALRCCPSKGGTPPGTSHWCQTGHQVQKDGW